MRHRKPHSLRHTVAAWSPILGVHPKRLVRLMGHGLKQMAYEVQGECDEGLDVDLQQIRGYFEVGAEGTIALHCGGGPCFVEGIDCRTTAVGGR